MADWSTLTYLDQAELAITHSSDWRERLQGFGDEIARDSREHAPVGHPSHGGAASIHCETDLAPEGWQARIGWEQRKFWMSFQDLGTVHQPARPFLEPALDRARDRI